MRPLIYRCPVTGLDIQGSVPDGSGGATYVPIDCPICKRPHLIDPATGKVPGAKPQQD